MKLKQLKSTLPAIDFNIIAFNETWKNITL